MGSNLRVKDSIVNGESEGKSFYEIIEASSTYGWRNFDQACINAFESNLLTEETAILYCSTKGVTSRGIDNVKKLRGEATHEVTNLQMKRTAPTPGGRSDTTAAPSSPGTKIKLK